MGKLQEGIWRQLPAAAVAEIWTACRERIHSAAQENVSAVVEGV